MNNQGQMVETPGCDTEWNGELFNDYDTSRSNLWTKFVDAFDEEIRDRYAYLRREGWFSVDKIMQYVYDDVIGKVGQAFYNQDMKYKYQDGELQLTKRDFCRGSREEYTRRWIYERLSYLDSRWERGDEALYTAVVRSNVVGVISFDIEVYHAQWVSVRFLDNTLPVLKRCMPGEVVNFSSTECLDIPDGFITNSKNNNIVFKAVGHIKAIHGIQQVQPSELNLQHMRRLIELRAPSSTQLRVLDLMNCENLQHLDVSGCTKLGFNVSTSLYDGVVDITNCKHLITCNISRTGLSGLRMGKNTGALELFDASSTNIDAVYISGQPYITDLQLDHCPRMGNVIIEQCPRVKSINLAETNVETLTIAVCESLDSVDLANMSYMENFVITGCPKLTDLNLRGFRSDKIEDLDLATCPQLEKLDISGAFYLTKLTLPESIPNLKNLNLSASAIKSIRYGKLAEHRDELDLSGMSLTTFNLSNNKTVTTVTGLDYEGTPGGMFYACSKLTSIACRPGGKLICKGNMSDFTHGCSALTTIPPLSQLDFSNASGSWAFRSTKITMATAKIVMDALKGTGNLNYGTFYYCPNITGQLPNNFFTNAGSVTSCASFFHGCTGINGYLAREVLAPLKKCGSMAWMFTGANLTSFAENLFSGLSQITTTAYMFSGMTSIEQVLPTGLLSELVNLSSADYMFNGCRNIMGGISETFFHTNTKLENIKYMFYNCTSLVGSIPNNLFKPENGKSYTNLKYIDGLFGNDGNTSYPPSFTGFLPTEGWLDKVPNLATASKLFSNQCNLKGTLEGGFFKNNPKVTDISYVFENTDLKGYIHEDSFNDLPLLNNVKGYYKGCDSLIGEIPERLFERCLNVRFIDNLFDGCKMISGQIPENLFHGYDEDEFDDAGLVIPHKFKIQTASAVFKDCHNLNTTLPDQLLYRFENCTTLAEMFCRCFELYDKIPNGFLDKCVKLISCANMFRNCGMLGDPMINNTDNIYAIPADLFQYNYVLEDVAGMFYMYWGDSFPTDYRPAPAGGTRLEGQIPGGLFITNIRLKRTGSMFMSNSKLKGMIPGSLFTINSNLEDVGWMFYGCGGFDELGFGILSTNKKLRVVTHVFCYCGGLEGTAPAIWTKSVCPAIDAGNVSNFQGAFYGCTKLTNYYSEIPVQWGGGFVAE